VPFALTVKETIMKKRIPARLLLVLGSVLLTIVLIEVAAQIYNRVRLGPDYINQKISVRDNYLSPIHTERINAARAWENTLELHPLFGYVYIGDKPGVNNYGFLCDQDFHITANGYALTSIDRSQTIVLGIFGGSFAHITAIQTKDFFSAELSRLFPGRTPIILNFAQGGYALPQTFFTFAYFRSIVDIPVFIDGLNEPWNYYLNNISGFPPEYAKAHHWAYRLSVSELSPETFKATSQLLQKRSRMKQLTELSLAPILRRSVLFHHLWNGYRAYSEHSAAMITRSIEEYYALSGEKFHDIPDPSLFSFSVNQWSEYHQLVHTLSTQAGLLDLHFLQPNPFVPGSSKKFTESEAEILSKEDWDSRFVVKNAYPLLKTKLAELSQLGIACVDLSDIFDGETDTIWTDICHSNEYGGMIIARKIMTEIEKRSEHWNPPY
jgi:hypothetical protein